MDEQTQREADIEDTRRKMAADYLRILTQQAATDRTISDTSPAGSESQIRHDERATLRDEIPRTVARLLGLDIEPKREAA